MQYSCYQVDSFSEHLFAGNPACVVPLDRWLSNENLLRIARENAVAETAFFIKKLNNIHLRWFTPDLEIDLCGHATLATAHILRSVFRCSLDEIVFQTMSGSLKVHFEEDVYYLDFPAREAEEVLLPIEIESSLNIKPKEILKSRDYMLIYNSENDIRDIKINRYFFDKINLGHGGVIVTAPGDSVDFVSRFFTPQATILEDPVTGSSHCTLIPFWSSRLAKKELRALQLSERGGVIFCKDMKERVIIGGKAITYSSAKIFL